ncbi:AraC family transcriptional regulator [Paenibacillus thalictri]|uniref:AraC family transcriptional regulator n=2 Tax=Paenibacillus thalictri TaxID=2527873 RepID=A0A4V2J4A5_9BACL|nr:AraC family transcriptional regulator [Paenibacillus thalictri]
MRLIGVTAMGLTVLAVCYECRRMYSQFLRLPEYKQGLGPTEAKKNRIGEIAYPQEGTQDLYGGGEQPQVLQDGGQSALLKEHYGDNLGGEIITRTKPQVEPQMTHIAEEMVNIVRERYGQDVSLDYCAAVLNFHPVYLSRVFKKEWGVNFSDYVADYRMNLAKSWLENTEMKVTEIAEQLSYTNTTAFIRIFRKKTGVTPGQYKDRFLKRAVR